MTNSLRHLYDIYWVPHTLLIQHITESTEVNLYFQWLVYTRIPIIRPISPLKNYISHLRQQSIGLSDSLSVLIRSTFLDLPLSDDRPPFGRTWPYHRKTPRKLPQENWFLHSLSPKTRDSPLNFLVGGIHSTILLKNVHSLMSCNSHAHFVTNFSV